MCFKPVYQSQYFTLCIFVSSSMNSFSIGGEDIYCMTHYKQAFTEKGTYDVFTPNKGKWTRKIEATSSELAKSQE